jgi:hypothetical protein
MDPSFVRHYRALLETVLRRMFGDSATIEILEPHRSPGECVAARASYEAVVLVDPPKGPVLVVPVPTDRGTLIVKGRERSPRLVGYKTADTDRPTDLSGFAMIPADLLRLLYRAYTVSTARDAAESVEEEGPLRQRGRPLSTPEIEGFVNELSPGRLVALDQTNLLSEVADLCRIDMPGGMLSPLSWRFVDASHRGRVCPLETPESTEIGLRLHVTHGTTFRRNSLGFEIVPGEPADVLGLSVSLVPFLHHDDGARAMMGGKNLKASVPIIHPEVPLVRTGAEERVVESSGRIVRAPFGGQVESASELEIAIKGEGKDAKLPLIPLHPSIPGTIVGHVRRVSQGKIVEEGEVLADWPGTVGGQLALGRNVLVAYLPWYGYNIEDGIVVSKELSEQFESEHRYGFEIEFRSDLGDALEILTSEGKDVSYGDGLACVRRGKNVRWLHYKERFRGRVTRIVAHQFRLEVWVKASRELEVGDKMTGRHGNKGVVTRILGKNETPYFEVGGTRYDVEAVLSPMGVVSRMNLGQLLETHYGWAAKRGHRDKPDDPVGKPFRELDVEDLRRRLDESGLPDGKAELFVDREGAAVSLGRVVVGYQYMCRLNHLARNKFHARGTGGSYSALTGQPVGGKQRGGGQRLGEMEGWALLAHGAFAILEEAFSAKSDDKVAREEVGAARTENRRPLLERGPSGTLDALRTLLRGLCLELELGKEDGSTTVNPHEAVRSHLRPVGEEEVRGWAPEKVVKPPKRKKKSPSPPEVALAKDAGGIDKPSQLRTPEDPAAYGYIDLRTEIPHPLLAAESLTRVKGEPIDDWKLRFDSAMNDKKAVKLAVVPVIPYSYRMDLDGRPDPLTRMYQRVVTSMRSYDATNRLKSATESQKSWKLYELCRDVNALFVNGVASKKLPSILSMLDGKFGLLRRNLLGKRQDFSARAVIVPDPELSVDECGVPLDMFVEFLDVEIESALGVDGSKTLRQARQGSREAREKVLREATKLVEKDKLLVLLNRQPSLHRHNVLAFHPRLREDFVIALPPLVCAGFNADFDGDTIALHLPLTKEAQREASRMLPSRNLFSPANGRLMLSLGQDYALGANLLSHAEEGRGALQEMLGADVPEGVTGARLVELVSTAVRAPGRDVPDMLKRLQEVTFTAATVGDASFSYFDVLECSLPHEQREAFAGRVVEYDGLGEEVAERSRLRAERASHVLRIKRLERERAALTGSPPKSKNERFLEWACGEPPRATGENDGAIPRSADAIKEEVKAEAKKARDVDKRLREIDERLGEKLGDGLLKEIASAVWENLPRENSFARYFHSGARGNKVQLRQIAGLIGYVYGSDGTLHETPIPKTFATGLSPNEYWALSFSTRRTMTDKKLGVAKAGSLTHLLVEGAYDVAIVADDCRTDRSIVVDGLRLHPTEPTEAVAWATRNQAPAADPSETPGIRSPLTCAAKRGICQACYGVDLSTNEPPAVGTLVGVIAGESVGERGTQLSMQTFHTGGKALPISRVRQVFADLRLEGLSSRLEDASPRARPQILYDTLMPMMYGTYRAAIAAVHFEVLMRAMLRGGRVRGLAAAAYENRRGFLAAASFQSARGALSYALTRKRARQDGLALPKTRVMLARRGCHGNLAGAE